MSALRYLLRILPCMALGCGAAPQHVEAPITPGQTSPSQAAWLEFEQAEGALDATLLGAPDCTGACKHLAALCALSTQICELSRTEPDQVPPSECEAASERCSRATERVVSLCQCD